MIGAIGDLLPVELGLQWRQLFTIQIGTMYICDGPDQHCHINQPRADSILQLPVLDSVNNLPIWSLGDAISNYLRVEKIERRCGECDSQWSSQITSIDNHPPVKPTISCSILTHCVSCRSSLSTTTASREPWMKNMLSRSTIPLRQRQVSLLATRLTRWSVSWCMRASLPRPAITTSPLSALLTTSHAVPTGATTQLNQNQLTWTNLERTFSMLTCWYTS